MYRHGRSRPACMQKKSMTWLFPDNGGEVSNGNNYKASKKRTKIISGRFQLCCQNLMASFLYPVDKIHSPDYRRESVFSFAQEEGLKRARAGETRIPSHRTKRPRRPAAGAPSPPYSDCPAGPHRPHNCARTPRGRLFTPLCLHPRKNV